MHGQGDKGGATPRSGKSHEHRKRDTEIARIVYLSLKKRPTAIDHPDTVSHWPKRVATSHEFPAFLNTEVCEYLAQGELISAGTARTGRVVMKTNLDQLECGHDFRPHGFNSKYLGRSCSPRCWLSNWVRQRRAYEDAKKRERQTRTEAIKFPHLASLSAPSHKGCVVKSQKTKASNK